MQITIRPLQETDSQTSYIWRGDADIWQYTGSIPNHAITYEMELDWIKQVLARPDEARFAICVGEDKRYIGNIQLTGITAIDAELHVFIGVKSLHNKGIATAAAKLLLDYAQQDLQLQSVYLYVNAQHLAAIRTYTKCGFVVTEEQASPNQLKMEKKLTP
ncbi:MAG: GNAT family N-acetyltransferase [Methylophilaceae bacterium]|nr:GNAT family protein [Methyloradius sp.]